MTKLVKVRVLFHISSLIVLCVIKIIILAIPSVLPYSSRYKSN